MKIKDYILIGLSILCIILFIKSCDKDVQTIEVPIKIEVPVPVVEKEFDTIYVPKPIGYPVENPINKDLSKDLDKAKSVIDSLKVYKDFAIKREYKETFEDSIQTITVSAETTGTLDKLQASYKSKPRTIPVDTIVSVDIPDPKTEFYFGAEVSNSVSQLQVGVGPSILMVNKKHTKAYKVHYDALNKAVTGGVYLRF